MVLPAVTVVPAEMLYNIVLAYVSIDVYNIIVYVHSRTNIPPSM